MHDAPTTPADTPTRTPHAGWGAVLALVLAVTAVRLVYLALACPYSLIEDEAFYWEWSRHLAWSYSTKGPGVAWAIWLSTHLLGVSEFGVRAPAAIFAAMAALGAAGATCTAFDTPRAPFFAAAAAFLTPFMQPAALLMTIDGPMLALWMLATWAAARALLARSGPAWVALGVAIGAGFLFKYTIALILPGLLVAALCRRSSLTLHARWRRWALGGLVALAGALTPVIIWNAQHDWATVRHLLGHLGVRGGDVESGAGAWTYNPLWTLEFLGLQLAFVGPMLFLGVYAAAVAWSRRWERPRDWAAVRLMLWCGLPTLIVYLGVTVFTRAEGNWALGAFVPMIPIAGWGAAQGLREAHARGRWTHRGVAWRVALTIGVISGVGMLRLDLLAPLMPGQHDPIGRLMSARRLAASTAGLMDTLRARGGKSPMVIAQHYGRAALLSFYLPGRPVVYCASSRMGGRRTDYDLWADTDLDNPALVGRDAVLVGGDGGSWSHVFERIEPVGPLAGDHKLGREAFLGHGFKGFAPAGDQ